ncbi:MAG TPA: ABC transporter permease, partial [Vicinamibacterales bacterium]|nr:ABC transporter permease [Vicinamibacterales bacterium]
TRAGEPRQVRARVLSADYFGTLGVPLADGRDFLRGEERPGAGHVAIVTAHLRHQIPGADAAVGGSITLNGRTYTIVGILPPYTDPFGAVDVYVPFQFDPALPRRFRLLTPVVRLNEETTFETVRAALRTITTGIDDPEAAGHTLDIETLRDRVSASSRSSASLLFAAAFGLFSIALLNFAMLVAARVSHRRQEFAVREALGAGRATLIRLATAEAVALGAIATVAALGLSRAVVPWLQRHYGLRLVQEVTVDARVLWFAALLTACAVLVAVAAAASSLAAAGVSGRRVVSSRLTAGRFFVVAQIALAMLLAASAIVLARGFFTLRQVDPGFRTTGLQTTRIALPAVTYATAELRARFWRSLVEALEHSGPGVGLTSELPLSGQDNPTSFSARLADGTTVPTRLRSVSAGYLRVMGVPGRAGRPLAETDRAGAPRVAVINESLAARLAPLGPPIGQRISFDVARTPLVFQVVGVCGDIRHERLSAEPAPEVYVPLDQTPLSTYSVVIETGLGATDVAHLVRATLDDIDRGLAFTTPVPMSDYILRGQSDSRFRTSLLISFAAAALIVASAGLHSLLTWLVAGARREWATRLALGASPARLRNAVLIQASKYGALGAAIGVVGFLPLGRLLEALAYGVSAADPWSVAACAAVMIGVSVLAAALPAARVALIDPAEVLAAGD